MDNNTIENIIDNKTLMINKLLEIYKYFQDNFNKNPIITKIEISEKDSFWDTYFIKQIETIKINDPKSIYNGISICKNSQIQSPYEALVHFSNNKKEFWFLQKNDKDEITINRIDIIKYYI